MRLENAKAIRLLAGPEAETEEAYQRKEDEKPIRGSSGQYCTHHQDETVQSEESSVCLKFSMNAYCYYKRTLLL